MSIDSDSPEGDIEPTKSVGYGAPPASTRFKKGVSGNPKGRPKGSMNLATTFMKTLREKVVINEHGQRRTITKFEAALKQLTNKAVSGELRALAQFVDLARDAEAKQNAPGAQEIVTSEVDREVMEGILSRFGNTTEQQETEENNNGNVVDTERG
jgi:ribosomal protein S20